MNKISVQEILAQVKNENRRILTEYESKQVLRAYEIPTTVEELASNQEEAAEVASRIGFPVVLKIVSPDITHKSDIGGVKLNIKNVNEVKPAFNAIINSVKQFKPDAKIFGVLVQKMSKPGREVIVGLTKDPQFGAVILFGLGGIFVEVLKDVSFRLPPISREDALEMISEVKGYPILKGIRGELPVDMNALADIIQKVSRMAMDLPEVSEMDMNPIFAQEKGVLAVDARIVLAGS